MGKTKLLLIKGALTAGGIDNLILSTLDELDFNKFEVSILTYNEAQHDWENKFEKFDCTFYRIPRARKGLIRFVYNQYRIMKKGKFDIIHAHTSPTGFLSAIAANLAGVKVSICHSHFDNYPQYKFALPMMRFMFNTVSCNLAACSDGAGKALYGNKNKGFTFIKNGIDTKKYAYNKEKRTEVRKKLNIENKFVVGNVARLSLQKNHVFLLETFKKVLEIKPDSILMLVGDGELREEVEQKILELNIKDSVMMLGSRNDVPDLLQAMDIFVLPTLFEGLSLALLEVQSSGLYCLTSDVVPKEVKVTDNFEFVSLEKGYMYWADRIVNKSIDTNRVDKSEVVRKSGFGKKEATKALEDYYSGLLKKSI
ncbi:glycosyltransferase family 1 protein [Clostridium sp. DL1XJH146]